MTQTIESISLSNILLISLISTPKNPSSKSRERSRSLRGPGWQMRNDFSNSPGRQKWNEFSNGQTGLQKKEDEKYCSSVRADKSIVLLLLLLLLLFASSNIHPVCSDKLGLTHTFCDRLRKVILRWEVVLNEVLSSFVFYFLYFYNMMFILWESGKHSILNRLF